MIAPFPYFGGKSRVASLVWERFGDVPNYVEPFFGSGAVLLGRQSEPKIETVNDLDGFLSNFWRAISHDPEAVAEAADWPVNECDLHARHSWLVSKRDCLTDRLMGDPDFYDARIAGYWVWGIASWIGGGWCSGRGPWQSIAGVFTDTRKTGDVGAGVNRKRPDLLHAGRGVSRRRPHLSDAGQGVNRTKTDLLGYFEEISSRMRRVRVCCGDWERICGRTPTELNGVTGLFLDPPYADTAGRDSNIYAKDSLSVAHDVRDWAILHGSNPKLRIALCGYDGEHAMPDDWDCVPWKAHGGYAARNPDNLNSRRERIWFSPACLTPVQ